jgi:hypothetical protein
MGMAQVAAFTDENGTAWLIEVHAYGPTLRRDGRCVSAVTDVGDRFLWYLEGVSASEAKEHARWIAEEIGDGRLPEYDARDVV